MASLPATWALEFADLDLTAAPTIKQPSFTQVFRVQRKPAAEGPPTTQAYKFVARPPPPWLAARPPRRPTGRS